MGLRIIHPLLEQKEGVEVHSIYFKEAHARKDKQATQKEFELFSKIISNINPDLVGISVMSAHEIIAKKLSKIVRKNSKGMIVWGGIHPTIFPERCIEEADAICRGEGEDVILEIVSNLQDGQKITKIQNLWVKTSEGIVKNSMRPLNQNLDQLPFPAYQRDTFYFIDNDKIIRKDSIAEMSKLQVAASRGCPNACSYCVNSVLRPLYKNLGRYVRRRSPKMLLKK